MSTFKFVSKARTEVTIPLDLAEAFRNAKMLSAWGKLRSSCQQYYVDRIEKSLAGEPRRKEIEKVLKFTNKYAVRHPNKYGRSKKAAVIN